MSELTRWLLLWSLILTILFMIFDLDYPVYDLWSWLSCLWPLILTILFMTFDLDYPVYDLWSWLSCLWPLIFLLPKTFKLFVFLIFWIWVSRIIWTLLIKCCVDNKTQCCDKIQYNSTIYQSDIRTGHFCLLGEHICLYRVFSIQLVYARVLISTLIKMTLYTRYTK
jgi:hypothetical protein